LSEHVLCCDCDECLNGIGGGLVLAGAGKTYATPPRSVPTLKERRSALAIRTYSYALALPTKGGPTE